MIAPMAKTPLRSEALFKALADPTRRRILKLLKKGSRTAGEIAESFPMTMGSLSYHYNALKAADLVRTRRRGRQIIYSINTSVFEDAATMLADLFNVDGAREESE
jgi:DNA-binding transcriptional ArsR family regulator